MLRNALKRLLLGGPTSFPQQFILGQQDPQSAVDVWLYGLGNRINVTNLHMMACGAPLTLCIGFDREQSAGVLAGKPIFLRFQERDGKQRVFGEIGLRFVSSFNAGTRVLCLFHTTHYKNYSLPPFYLWTHYLLYARSQRQTKDKDVPITAREVRAMIVFYLCPRPVVLVTVVDGETGNMFPMNLMGAMGDGYFAFSLNSHRAAAPLVKRIGKVVLSTIPLEEAPRVSRLGSNHRKASIEWSQLPFPLLRPDAIDAPIPSFTLKARKLQVEAVRDLGSHTLFVAKMVAEERLGEGQQFFVAHGLYQAITQRNAS